MNKKSLFVFCILFLLMLCTNVYASDEYIIKLRGDVMLPFSAEDELEEVSFGNNIYTTDEETAKKLQAQGLTEYIEENAPIEAYSLNDTYASEQTYLQNAEIEEFQKKYGYGKGVRVAVVDSGVYREHEDLKNANIETGWNILDDNDDTTDTTGHGTSVMGILCATANNGVGIAGIAPEATYVPFVVMTEAQNGDVIDVAEAVGMAVDEYDCKIINISAGTKTSTETMKTAMDYAASKGAIVVCAAGNNGTVYNYPASYDSTISVGAVTSSYTLASYSQKNKKVDVVAEGTFYMPINTGGYSNRKGTSFSSPVIAGIATLLAQKNSDMTATDFKNAIKAGTMDILSSGKDYAGYGYPKIFSMEEYLESDDEVFVSPVYQSGTSLNIKLFANSAFETGCMVMSYFSDERFSGYKVKSISTSDGVYFTTGSTNTYSSDELHIFAVEDVTNLRSISDKKVLNY